MATETAPLTLRAQRVDREFDLTTDLGTVSFGPRGELGVLNAKPNCEEFLKNLVATVNAKANLRIKIPPPEGGKSDGIYFLTVARTAPDLLEMMRQYLEQKYNVRITGE